MFKKIDTETKVGGICAIIAIVAGIFEMAFNGFTSDVIAGGLKDIFGTLVAVMVLFVAIKRLLPKKAELPFEDRLKTALIDWVESNSTMIIKSDDDDKTYKCGYSMRTDPSDFYRVEPLTKNAGWFVRLPTINKDNYQKDSIVLQFHLNKGTFFEGIEMTREELLKNFEPLNSSFCKFINSKYGPSVAADGKADLIDVKFRNGIKADDDISLLVAVLNSMLQAYLVSANIKTK